MFVSFCARVFCVCDLSYVFCYLFPLVLFVVVVVFEALSTGFYVNGHVIDVRCFCCYCVNCVVFGAVGSAFRFSGRPVLGM